MAKHRYPALQGYARIVKIVAIVVAAMIVLGGLVAAAIASSAAGGFTAAAVVMLVAIAFGWLAYVGIGASGDLAQLLIDVEAHLRRIDGTPVDPHRSA